MDEESRSIANFCEQNLNLSQAKLSNEYYYNSLPFCVIDSIFSIGVNYSSTRQVVVNYCDYFCLKRIRKDKNRIPDEEEQESISSFCKKFEELGAPTFTDKIFKNKQRTSTKAGVLKSEAVYLFCKILQKYHVEYMQNVKKIILDKKFEEDIKKIKGQKSGISLRYFFMLSGSEDLIKPDRMILRFLEKILRRRVSLTDAQEILRKTSENLKSKYPNINPRILDHQIWNFESGRFNK